MAHTKHKTVVWRILILVLVMGFLTISVNGARKGLVTEKYPGEFYRVPKLLPDGPMERNPTFIVYGDGRPGWRAREKFLDRENWMTWKMLIFPFYEIYWLGNGVVGGVNWLRHTPDYGIRERHMVRDAVYAEAEHSPVDFILNTGDMPTDGRRPKHWERFLRENRLERPLLMDFPYLPVVGNHERANDPTYGAPNYQAIFAYPPFYVLDFPDAALFVVDSNIILDQYQFIDDQAQEALFKKWFISGNPEQPAWLERELAARNKTFKMVAMHHPPISFGEHHKDWFEKNWGEKLQEKRGQLLKLFYEQGVRVVFCGHEHLYEHSIVRYGPDGNQREIHFIVSGGAGAPVRRRSDAKTLKRFLQEYRNEGLDVRLIRQEDVYNYGLVAIGTEALSVKIFEVSDQPGQPLRLLEEILVQRFQ